MTWTEPNAKVIFAGDEFSLQLSTKHISRSHDYYTGIGIVSANFFKVDDQNQPIGYVTNLEDEDGNVSYASAAKNGYQPLKGDVKGQLGYGTKDG